MTAAARSCTVLGIEAKEVIVETQVIQALKRFSIVGLPDSALRESKDRVRCAIENSGFRFPNREVIVSLSPAGLPKHGPHFDLAIAVSILAADGQLPTDALRKFLLVGELGLNASLQSSRVAIPATLLAKKMNLKGVILPSACAPLAKAIPGTSIYPASTLADVHAYLRHNARAAHCETLSISQASAPLTYDDVRGQYAAKRVFEIAAAGGHNVLLSGPPGSGKSMLAERMPSILPPLSLERAIESAAIRAAGNAQHEGRLTGTPPFRAPHHSCSLAGLIGGGTRATPGEVSLAHGGVLFLDELPEFRRDALEALRIPLEKRSVVISRANCQTKYPAHFRLIAAMNPCPCGMLGEPGHHCDCLPPAIKRYAGKISGPLKDRIDLHAWVPRLPAREIHQANEASKGETHAMRERVLHAQAIQKKRLNSQTADNASMPIDMLLNTELILSEAKSMLEKLAEKHQLSARGYSRTLRVARSIADLEEERKITTEHVREAMSYRLPKHVVAGTTE